MLEIGVQNKGRASADRDRQRIPLPRVGRFGIGTELNLVRGNVDRGPFQTCTGYQAVGLDGVDRANVRLGDSVVVHGTGLVGLGVVAACRHRGADVIVTGYFPAGFGGEPGPRAVLRNMASGALPWSTTITHRLAPEDAPAVYERLLDGERADILGATVQWRT